MKAALAVLALEFDPARNLSALLDAIDEAARAGADLVVFCEAVLTGFVHIEEPEHDLPLGEAVDGAACERIAARAKARSITVAFGLLEREGSRLYDSALLFDPQGELLLHYRRVHPGWHRPEADPAVYRQGDAVLHADTTFGRIAFLLCGDLFGDALLAETRALEPDLLLFPFWRCFEDLSYEEARWLREEHDEYVRRAVTTGATSLMVNALAPRDMEGGAFGGAMVVAPDGRVLARLPLGRPGLLVVDLEEPREP